MEEPQKHLFSSVTQSCPTLCNLLDGSTPGFPVHQQLPELTPNSCPLSWWCHPTVWSSVVPFSPCLQSFPALGSFQMSQVFTAGGQSIGVSTSASVLPMNIQDWSPLGWTGWISLQSKRFSRVFSNTTVQKQFNCYSSILQRSAFFIVQLSHLYMTTGKTGSLDYPNLCRESDGKFADKSPDFSFQIEGNWQLPSVTDGSRHIPQHIPKIVP